MNETYVPSVVTLSVADDTPARMSDALAYMAQHCDAVTLAGVAAGAGQSPAAFARDVRRYVGVGFSELLAEMRMQRAATLVSAGVGVAAAAASCGYGDARRFSAAFRRRFGATPAAWARGREGR